LTKLRHSLVNPAIKASSVPRHASEVVKEIYIPKRNFTCCRERAPQTDFSRFEALVRKRESLLKFIYERRKGEGCSAPGRKRGPFS